METGLTVNQIPSGLFGSIPKSGIEFMLIHGPLVKRLRHRPFKPVMLGSIPAGTIMMNRKQALLFILYAPFA